MEKGLSPILPMHNTPHSVQPSGLHGYPSLQHTWNRLRAWLATEYNELGDTLNYGIDPAIITSVEMELGLPLPSAVRESYLICDGQEVESSAGCSEGLFFGLTLLPLEDVLEEWRFWREVDEDPNTGANDHLRTVMQSIPEDYVRREYSCRGWLPLVTDRAGNYLGVDLHPADQGSYGQVIVFGRDFDTKVVMWRGEGEGGWGRWLSGLVDELENHEGFELGGSGDGSSGSEDELGYESYFFSASGAGRGPGADGASAGLRLTGEYKGWNVLEAWADRSVKRWVEAGLYKPPEPERPDIEITSSSPTKPTVLDAGRPEASDSDQASSTFGAPSTVDDASTATTPTTPRPPESATTERAPSVHVTVPPIPKPAPIPMPTTRDLLGESSPVSSTPTSPRNSGDATSLNLQSLASAPTRRLAGTTSDNNSMVEFDQSERPLVSDTSFSSVTRGNSTRSMASAELMAAPARSSADNEVLMSSITNSEPVLSPPLTAIHKIDLVTPTAKNFTSSDASSSTAIPATTTESSRSNGVRSGIKLNTVAARIARSDSPGALASPSKIPLPDDTDSPMKETSDQQDSRPGTPSSIVSAASKLRHSKPPHRSTKSITSLFGKEKEGGKEREKVLPALEADGVKEKEKQIKRNSGFGSPLKGMRAGATKKKDKDEVVVS